jgi:hypothetical protein
MVLGEKGGRSYTKVDILPPQGLKFCIVTVYDGVPFEIDTAPITTVVAEQPSAAVVTRRVSILTMLCSFVWPYC